MLTTLLPLALLSPRPLVLDELWSQPMPRTLGIARTVNRTGIAALYEHTVWLVNPQTGAVQAAQEGWIPSETRYHTNPRFVFGHSRYKDFPYLSKGFPHTLETIQTEHGPVNVHFQGNNISYGYLPLERNPRERSDEILVVWKTGTGQYTKTNARISRGDALVGDPDTGVYAFAEAPHEHRPPYVAFFKADSRILLDDHFVFDIKGDLALRAVARQYGVDVTPENLYLMDVPNKKILWQHPEYKDYTTEAYWLESDILAYTAQQWRIIDATNGATRGLLPQLTGATHVTTVKNTVYAYFKKEGTLKAFLYAPPTR